MTDHEGPRRVWLDSAKLRCLAHPLRSRLLSALRMSGPATSSRLAARLGTNTGATSYHLRRLAEVGLVEEDVGRGTARERWWRAAHDLTSFSETDFDVDPDDRAAAEWLLARHLRVTTRWREDWLEQRQQWPTAWRAAANTSDVQLRLSAEQMARMGAEILDVIDRYREAGPDPEDEAERVMVLLDCFPTTDVSL